MKVKLIWIAFSVLAFLIFLPMSISTYKDWQVYNKGMIGNAELISVPGTKGFIEFKLGQHVYSKQLSAREAGSLKVGDTIQLKFFPGYESHFLFPHENPISSDVTTVALLFFSGFACLYYALKKSPPPIIIFGKKIAS